MNSNISRSMQEKKGCLRNVVSLRVDDREMEELEKVLAGSNKRVSDFLREALSYWLSQNKNSLQGGC